MKNLKSFDETELTGSEVTNEDLKYRQACKDMKDHIDAIAHAAMKSVKGKKEPENVVIKISVGKESIDIPFNADSYERLDAFLRAEIKEDKDLEKNN